MFSGGESTRCHFPGLGPRAGAWAGAEADKGFITVIFDQFNERDFKKKSALKIILTSGIMKRLHIKIKYNIFIV